MDILTWLCGCLLAVCLPQVVIGEEGSKSCGGQVDASGAGYITTPGYPLEYPPHQNCRWVVTAPEPSQRVVLNFNPHFELEKLDCRYDYVEIRDGNSEKADLLGKHCSNIAPPAIISSGPVLLIRFVSDYAHQGAGFSLRYEIFKTGSDCSRNFTSQNGIIESPGFPDKYPHNLECSFIIIMPPAMDLTLTFLTFDLENDPLPGGEGDCKYDWLEVWDGLPQVGPLIGRYCGTKIPPEMTSSTGILSLSFHTDMAVAKDGFSARYNMTHKEVSDTFHCSNALGLESGKISDDQITASSSFYDNTWLPRQARLNNNNNAWTPNEDSSKEFIQVDLHVLKVLTGISYYVITFKLEVSTNGEDWMVYRYGKNHKVFHANTDSTEVVLNRIPLPVLARFVRVRPQTWKTGIALRLELYGCQITDAPCSEMQGMLSGLLPDSQITASSMRDIHGSMGTARLVASRSGWFPSPTQPLAGEEWLQVDLGVPKTVRGVITQGVRTVEGSTSAENRAFVRKYRVSHSLTGKDWTFILDRKTSHPKIFEGNTHYDTPEIRRFEEITAQFIRIYPERWSPAGIGMRLEVLGCELPGKEMFFTPISPRTHGVATICGLAALWVGRAVGWQSCGLAELWVGRAVDVGNFLHIEASPRTERQRARLVSPAVGPERGPLCLLFNYQLQGPENQGLGSLRILLRDNDREETLLWALRGDQGPVWKEGRTILPQSPKEYQVVIEGYFEHGNRGHIWIDNIHMSSSTELEQCTRKSSTPNPKPHCFPFPEWSTPGPSMDPPVTRVSEKDNSWLYTLDPILVTIIVMSSLGVLLGAVCGGLLLYCTCYYSGLSSRSSTTLENYNFELYDGIKHKVKINQQRCCSEA
uniref:Neuropilin n=1 Tax=Oncorhynchus kisutch TaxID=8019 RepID=A0A8C7CIN1_ONCKI